MHELSCARRNWHCIKCEVCDAHASVCLSQLQKTILKSEKEAHLEEYHKDVTCEWCGKSVVLIPLPLRVV